MIKADVVLGMNFGDEGKGHITNFLSSSESLVVRFNGGPQAAHRVILSDGREHVFRHFGSGTMKGARTLFAHHFMINPMAFLNELNELRTKARLTAPLIDPRCRFTTPYDMLINQFAAVSQGITNTVGMGINETVQRNCFDDLRITARTILDKTDTELEKILLMIENDYTPWRLKHLSLDADAFRRFAVQHGSPQEWVRTFLQTSRWMLTQSAVYPEEEVISRFLTKKVGRNLIFEGAQGVLLDQLRKGEDPKYLTASSTNLRNVIEALRLVTVPLQLDVHLVSRAYLTRHGDGPLWDELPGLPYAGVEDPTNETNKYQGSIRYAFLHEPWLGQSIVETESDIEKASLGCVHDHRIVQDITCVDHLDGYDADSPLKSKARIGIGEKEHELGDLFWTANLISTGHTEAGVKKAAREAKRV